MKITIRAISLICVLAMLVGSLVIVASASAGYKYEEPFDPGIWKSPNFSTDHAYSLAFVGDTQYITCGDYFQGTKKLQQQFKFIADTAEERKLEHVFVLGDITDMGYWNDRNLASRHVSPPNTGEWEIAKSAISQLDGVVTYSLCRGNHDDYMIDDYFNVPAYTNQFKDCGGFFSDSNGKHSGRRETKNPEGYIYWSAKSGYHKNSIVNSWMTKEICGTKYLFITVDYNPTKAVIDWLNELLPKYPDHKAIITTHSYLDNKGDLISSESGDTMYPTAYPATKLWSLALKKHQNVFMVVSGHVGVTVPFYSIQRGDKGNRVIQVLVDPQSYDSKEISATKIEHGHQDTGLVLYMNFSKDGKTITFDYYSTLLNKFLYNSDYKINIEDGIDEEGSIDMAGLSQFGQETPLVKDKKTPTLDGVINANEYSYSRVIKQETIKSASIKSDLTEYFAYDDNYIYYGFKVKSGAIVTYKLHLHFGSSIYSLDELNDGSHSDKMIVGLNDENCTQESNVVASKLINDRDISCKLVRDSSTRDATYEIKIRRDYLEDNKSPDNLFSYLLYMGQSKHQFNLSNDVKNHLSDLGVTKSYNWTYNYVYFGSRPEPTPEDISAETTAPIVNETTAPDVDSNAATTADAGTDTAGCGSTIGTAAFAIIPLGVSALMLTKKRKSKDR